MAFPWIRRNQVGFPLLRLYFTDKIVMLPKGHKIRSKIPNKETDIIPALVLLYLYSRRKLSKLHTG